MQGKFDLGYFIKGNGKEDWFKALGNGWRIGIITLVAFLLILGISTIFKKNIQQTKIGEVKGNVNIIQKSSRFFIPFIEGGVEQKSNSDLATFIRGGIRVEF